MSDPTPATITGHISLSQGVVSGGVPVSQPATGLLVKFTPGTLDTSGMAQAVPIYARVDATGAVLALDGTALELWPGSWTVDANAVAGMPFTFTVTAAQVADLYTLRGYVPGPGVNVTTAALPADAVGYLHDDGAGGFSWDGTPAVVVLAVAGVYPARPNVPAGMAWYKGPTQPTDWLTGDTWTEMAL